MREGSDPHAYLSRQFIDLPKAFRVEPLETLLSSGVKIGAASR